MNLDSILRSTNQYMNDIFNTFGGESKEYMNALKQVKEALPETVLNDTARQGLDYEGAAPDKPLQLSRSKSSKEELSHFGSDLQELRELQKETGTARKLTKPYIEDAKARGKDPSEIDVKEEAFKKYDFDNHTNDWYDDVMADPDIPDDVKEEIRDKYSQLHDNYEDANFRDELERMVRDAQSDAEALRESRQAEEEPAAPSDVGYNVDDDFGGIQL